MGQVVHFPLSTTRRENRDGGAGATGRILLFTGVRYERHDREEPLSPPPAVLGGETPTRRRKVRRRA
jgi:hypothetical protein